MAVMKPVMEYTIILAGTYAKACGRDTLTALDMEYAMKYSARHRVGIVSGSLFTPEEQKEIYDEEDSEDDEEEEDEEEEEEEEPEFTRYSGDDEMLNAVNECYDTWSSWIPCGDAEVHLKNAIDYYNDTD